MALTSCGGSDDASLPETGNFIRLPGEGASMTAGYLSIASERDDALVAAEVEGVTRTELHVSMEENGVTRMRRADRFEVEAGERLVLEPMGRHLMLIGIEEDFAEGETRRVTLTFESGRTETMELEVRGVVPGRS
jgi:copper(I)-binding protein